MALGAKDLRDHVHHPAPVVLVDMLGKGGGCSRRPESEDGRRPLAGMEPRWPELEHEGPRGVVWTGETAEDLLPL